MVTVLPADAVCFASLTSLRSFAVLNVDMNLYFDIESYMDTATGQVSLPPEDEQPDTNVDCNGPRVFIDCFPERTGEDTHTAVDFFRQNNNNDNFLDEFADVFGRLIERTKIASDL